MFIVSDMLQHSDITHYRSGEGQIENFERKMEDQSSLTPLNDVNWQVFLALRKMQR